MINTTAEPPIPAKPTDRPFVQQVCIKDDYRPLATAWWHASPTRLGSIQIVDLHVEKIHRRKGIGGQLLNAVIQQAIEYHRRHRRTLRHIWLPIAQKAEIAARAFLSEANFHHVATLSEVLRDEDILLYKRSLD